MYKLINRLILPSPFIVKCNYSECCEGDDDGYLLLKSDAIEYLYDIVGNKFLPSSSSERTLEKDNSTNKKKLCYVDANNNLITSGQQNNS